jgi:hypothetical protein
MHRPDVSKVWPQARLAAKINECPQDASHDHGNDVKRCEQEVEHLHERFTRFVELLLRLLLAAPLRLLQAVVSTFLSRIPGLSSGQFICIKSRIRLAVVSSENTQPHVSKKISATMARCYDQSQKVSASHPNDLHLLRGWAGLGREKAGQPRTRRCLLHAPVGHADSDLVRGVARVGWIDRRARVNL